MPVLFSVGSFDFYFWGDLVHICIVLINTSCEENRESQAHGYGRVPAPAAVRLLTSRPLLPSASAAGIPRCRGNGGLLDGARGNMPWCLCRWPLHMAARAGACSRPRFGWRASAKVAGGAPAPPSRQTSKQPDHADAGVAAARPVPAEAAAGPGPTKPQNTQGTTQQDKTQPKGNTTKPSCLIKISCL